MKVRGWMPLTVALVAASALADTFVVAVGVEQYDDLRVSSLRYAIADAKAVAGTFRASGVPFDHVTVLTSEQRSPDRRPSRVRVLAALEAVAEQAKAGDNLVFFFAGHGIEQDGEQYLMTVDTRRSLVPDTALPMRLVNKALTGIGASNVLFILDACRNDPDSGRGDRDAPLTDGLCRGLRPALAKQGQPGPHVATLLSCDVGQRAWEDPGQGHGAFTVYLLKALRGAAGSPVTLKTLASYVTRETSAWAKRAKRAQSPKLLDPDNQDMQLLTPPPEPMVSVSFQNDTLAKVVDVLAEQYGVPIVVGRGVDVESKVTGHLDNQPLSVTLKVLLKAHDLSVQRDGDVYVILPPGQEVEPPAPKEEAYQVTGDELVVDQQNGPYKTIGEAVKAARTNATVLVKPGTYREQVVIDRPLRLIGAGRPEDVQIVGQVAERASGVLTVAAGPSEVSRLSVTLEDSAGEDPRCAVSVTADATLRHVLLSAPEHQGKGCQVYSARAELLSCTVLAAAWCVEGWRGGIQARDCLLRGRLAGLMVDGATTAELTDCRIVSRSHAVQLQGTDAVSLVRCDLSEAPLGAFLSPTDATLAHQDCTFAPSDRTVATVAPSAVAPRSFAKDVILVDPAGQGDFVTLPDALRAARPGATVRLVPGRYDGRLVLTKRVTIEGLGKPEETTIEAIGMPALILNFTEATVRNVHLWSPVGPTRLSYATTVYAGYRSVARLENCLIRNVDPAAFSALSTHTEGTLVLNGCTVSGGPTTGISPNGSAALTDCVITDCGQAGIRFPDKYVPRLGLTNTTIERCQGGGLVAERSAGRPLVSITVSGGAIRNNQQHGVRLQGPVTATFEKTSIVANALAGLQLRDGAKATVTGCDLRGNGTGPFDIGPGCTLEQKDNQLGR